MLEKNFKEVFDLLKNNNDKNEKITLVGATKYIDAPTICKAYDLGLTHIGENKPQEFRDKLPFYPNVKKHFIGHLQKNKLKYIIGNVHLIQSVDSTSLAHAINELSIKKNITSNILLEVNISNSITRSGFAIEEINSIFDNLSTFTNIKILGLMCLLTDTNDELILTHECKLMREKYDELKSKSDQICYLSMGMSSDYKIAIKNGSNMIRLGSKLFN